MHDRLTSAIHRLRIIVEGTVQGVGFRPFVHRLATRLGLTGTVCNASSGVTLEVEGSRAQTRAFVQALSDEAPPLARISAVRSEELESRGDTGFCVVPSTSSSDASSRRVLVPPDVATCSACLREMNNPSDRRHRYPFINCTDCGPRFTIIDGLPYDRPLTAMRDFPLCPACLAEYREISCRRYHAQPVACPECGPGIWLVDPTGYTVARGDDALAQSVGRLESGQIGAIKGLGGFHLACHAGGDIPVQTLRRRKRREHKPFAVMARDLSAVEHFARVSDVERELLEGWRRPIVLLATREPSPLASAVSGTSGHVGTMLPYTPLHQLLLQEGDYPALVMTSGNLSDEPILCDNQLALARLQGVADFFLLHDRPILHRADDSVMAVMPAVNELPAQVSPVRRSRGHVPEPLMLPHGGPSVVAMGSDLKNVCAVTRDEMAILGPHVGDLEHADAADLLRVTVTHLLTLLRIEPQLVVHDLHPDYHSTRLARELGFPALAMQHHHAHALSCLAENDCSEAALALTLDGTGLGTDGAIWGGELLRVDGLRFDRLAHLRYLPLPGGDRAAHEPWRMALSALATHHDGAVPDALRGLAPFAAARPDFVEAVLSLVRRPDACPMTSSAGRLFDAAAAILGLRQVSTFEGQAAMELEQASREGAPSPLPYRVEEPVEEGEAGGPQIVDLVPALAELARALVGGAVVPELAWRFHHTVATAWIEVTVAAADRTGIDRVALTGGALQNRLLHRMLVQGLTRRGLRPLTHHLVPPNDGGLALGQAWAGVLSLLRS